MIKNNDFEQDLISIIKNNNPIVFDKYKKIYELYNSDKKLFNDYFDLTTTDEYLKTLLITFLEINFLQMNKTGKTFCIDTVFKNNNEDINQNNIMDLDKEIKEIEEYMKNNKNINPFFI